MKDSTFCLFAIYVATLSKAFFKVVQSDYLSHLSFVASRDIQELTTIYYVVFEV